MLLECVVNVSEGRDEANLRLLAAAAGPALLDQHRDPDHNRSVLTLAGPADLVADAARSLARAAVGALDLRHHHGAHPRLGVLDVVPFVPYSPGRAAPEDLGAAVAQRDGFAHWLGEELGVPAFVYGPLPGGRIRTLPEVRRLAVRSGSRRARPRSGTAGGRPPPRRHRRGRPARPARLQRLGLLGRGGPAGGAPSCGAPRCGRWAWPSGSRAQVSCNLLDPDRYGPGRLYDAVAALVSEAGGTVEGGELVGLIPEVVLAAVPPARRAELGLSDGVTVESRLRADR